MSGKKARNIDLPKYVTKAPTGAYKYQRRVPLDVQKPIGRAIWEYGLTSDPDYALRRAFELAKRHDAEISQYRRPTAIQEDSEYFEALSEGFSLKDSNKPEWENTPQIMRLYRGKSNEAERLAIFLALAFGESAEHAILPLTDPMKSSRATFSRVTPIIQPSDPTDSALFEAYKAMIKGRLREVTTTQLTDGPALSTVLAAYLKNSGSRR